MSCFLGASVKTRLVSSSRFLGTSCLVGLIPGKTGALLLEAIILLGAVLGATVGVEAVWTESGSIYTFVSRWGRDLTESAFLSAVPSSGLVGLAIVCVVAVSTCF